MAVDVQLFIGGAWVEGGAGRRLALVNPSDEQPAGSVAVAEAADIERAAQSAQRGFATWRSTPPHERSAVLHRAAQLLRERAADIAPVLTEQQGKTLFEARYEVMASAESFDWFAEEARRAYGRIVPSRISGMHQLVFREPVGPVAGFVPWNFGMGQAARKVGPALAAGCSIVLKGPEETPSCCAFLVEALVDAGLPDEVIGLLFGVPADISQQLIAHPAIRKVSFTGSTAVGKLLAELAGRHMKRITMELGGHGPVIVTDDVDIDRATQMLVGVKYRNAGQVCHAPTRFMIEENAYPAFVEAFAAKAAAIKVADGASEGAEMGPLANARRLKAMEALVADALEHGGRVVQGGRRIGNRGNFFEPTVLADVPVEARIMNEEPFGPVAIMRPFADLDEAIAEANRLEYGLAAYAFTSSNTAATRIADCVEAGMVAINGFGFAFVEVPFGGVKESGYGSEGGSEAIDAYLSTKMVSRASL
ncbi:MAG: NAD-dependent succinate-semialdehyde dehydrogenase [Pseudomonadota bacterium]|nr:NAD-dependent succinate-semialdehyde dehydrogenase [Pseudomonadota bacterium]